MKWRKAIRLKDYDYETNGYYFITICTALRKPLLEQYRKEAELILESLPLRFTGVKFDFYSLMPDHLHAIFILNNADVSVGEIVRTYKALVTRTTGCKPFWEWNYYEHIIRNERALFEIRKYIQENPEKEKIDLKAVYRRINATATYKSTTSKLTNRTVKSKQGK
jgi:putative transposase